VTYTPVALAALFQSQIDALNVVASTRAQWRATVLAARALTLTVNEVYSALQTILRSQYGNASDALADFGMAPRKVTKKSPLTKVIAAERNLATRTARGTRGPKAKLAIQGTASAPEIASSVAAAMGPAPAVSNGAEPAPAGQVAPPVTQVIAAAKSRATRAERGTRGKKAKLAIVGTVSASQVAAKVTEAMAPAITPVAAPATNPARQP
jgi:hypothetical protein